MPGFSTGKVTNISRPASTYVDLVFETPSPLEFIPGQFISIKVNERDIRSYSLAGVVGEKSYRMIVDIKPGGPGSKYFEALQVGDEMTFLGPVGKFVYQPDDGTNEVIFLVTGSGIAPIKAMIEEAIARGENRKMTLYFGLRYFDDIFWNVYFDELQRKYSNIKFVLCLSKPDERWHGVTGHITDFLDLDHQNLAAASAYLCGNGKMIEEAVEILERKGMIKEKVYFEKFF